MLKTSPTYGDDQNISTLSCLNNACSDKGLMLETSTPYTTYGDDHNILNLICPNYSWSDEGLTVETSNPQYQYLWR